MVTASRARPAPNVWARSGGARQGLSRRTETGDAGSPHGELAGLCRDLLPSDQSPGRPACSAAWATKPRPRKAEMP